MRLAVAAPACGEYLVVRLLPVPLAIVRITATKQQRVVFQADFQGFVDDVLNRFGREDHDIASVFSKPPRWFKVLGKAFHLLCDLASARP